jgi:rubrerythrin
MSDSEQSEFAAAPVIAQDGYNYPISYWICWTCERKIHAVFAGTPAGEPCPTCNEPMEYFTGILVDKKPEEVREAVQ